MTLDPAAEPRLPEPSNPPSLKRGPQVRTALPPDLNGRRLEEELRQALQTPDVRVVYNPEHGQLEITGFPPGRAVDIPGLVAAHKGGPDPTPAPAWEAVTDALNRRIAALERRGPP